MKLYQTKEMTYFTSWEINLFLCLVSLGLPEDLVGEWTRKMKKIHREFVLEECRDYYLDRKDWLPKTGSEKDRKLLRDRQEKRAYGYCKEINMEAISPIKSITHNFWMNIQKVHWEYEKKLEEIEPEDRYDYFLWAYENFYYKSWNCHPSKNIGGFHPGRFYLMDLKRGVKLEDIRDLEEIGAWQEERFIRGKKHIEDLIKKKNVHKMKEKVCREITRVVM